MLVRGPFPTSAMGRAGGEGSSCCSSDSGSPLTACEWRRSLASSWEWSWYLGSRRQHGKTDQHRPAPAHSTAAQLPLSRGTALEKPPPSCPSTIQK